MPWRDKPAATCFGQLGRLIRQWIWITHSDIVDGSQGITTDWGENSLRSRLLLFFTVVVPLVCLLYPVKTTPVTPPHPATKPVDFNRDIRPILSDTCFKCHGPDAKQRMANLRLDDTEGLFVDRGGYRIIVPNHAEQSKLYQKISSADASFRMPPISSGRTLTAGQIELIKEWIDQGAKWEMLWSFVPPKRPARSRSEG